MPNVGDYIHITASVQDLTAFSIDPEPAELLSGRVVQVIGAGTSNVAVRCPLGRTEGWWLRPYHFRALAVGDRLRVPAAGLGLVESHNNAIGMSSTCASFGDNNWREITRLPTPAEPLSIGFRCECRGLFNFPIDLLVNPDAPELGRGIGPIVSRRPPPTVRKATVTALPLP